MKPFIKWPGGKTDEYKILKEYFPKSMDSYIEPFVGGGAIYLNIDNAKNYYINDKSEELVLLYKYIQQENMLFFSKLNDIIHNWRQIECVLDNHQVELVDKYLLYSQNQISEVEWKDFIIEFIFKNSVEFNGILETKFNIDIKHFILILTKTIINKTRRMKSIEEKKGVLSKDDIYINLETAFKSSYYTHFRYLYNKADYYNLDSEFRIALFYFIREFCYSSMFRYNKSGDFNVPYGGASYNKKNIEKKITEMHDEKLVKKLNNTYISSLDFEEILSNIYLSSQDFLFLDPPYDSEFSTYSKNVFDNNDHIRLSLLLKKTPAKFMLVIKNTDFINHLYSSSAFNISSFDKKYLVSFNNRNNKSAEHLIIKNY